MGRALGRAADRRGAPGKQARGTRGIGAGRTARGARGAQGTGRARGVQACGLGAPGHAG